jgi:hypothetical protein
VGQDDAVHDHPTGPSSLRPVRALARLAIAGLVLAGLAWAARGVWQIRLAVAGRPGGGPPDAGGGEQRLPTALEDGYHVVNTLGAGAALLCAVVFLAWLGRVRDNAEILSDERPRHGEVWFFLGWILPIANLWVPRGIVADAFRKSAPGTPLPWAVNLWWGLWLAGLFGGVGLTYADDEDEVVRRAHDDLGLLLAADAAVVGSAVACVFVVRALTAVQEAHRTGPVPVADAVAEDPSLHK